jgi:hypothetical protein
MAVTLDRQLDPAPAAKPESVAMALGCVGLFLLPFAAVGLGTFFIGLSRALQGNLPGGGLLLLVGAIFSGVAGAGYTALVVGRRKLLEQEALKARHPDQPWLWRSDWASGRISDAGRGAMWGSVLFAGLWNLISFPVGFFGVREALQLGNKAGFVALLFPLVGTGLLVWALRNTLRFRRYGISVLELSTIPASIGNSLAGQVRTSSLIRPDDGFEQVLSCIHRVTTGSGENSSTSETILWQEEKRVRGELSRDAAGMSVRVPVSFSIPADARGTDFSNFRDQIVWRLQLSASVPGVDFQSVFEVPVFHTAASESSMAPAAQPASTGPELLAADYRQPADSRIAVNRNRRGLEITLPAARNPGVALGSVVFTLLWCGIVAALIRFHAPLLFPIVFGGFALLLIYGTLQLCLTVTRVNIDQGSIVIAEGYLYPGGERKIVSSDVSDIGTKISMQAGSHPYYDVVVKRRDGKQTSAGRWIRNKREAEWLAFLMKQELGLKRSS